MASMVSTGTRRPEVKTLDLHRIGAAPDSQAAVNSPAGDWILPILMRALDRTMPRKEAAFHMGIDAAQLTRQGNADGHLSVRRLGALGPSYWRHVVEELSIEFGLLDRADLIAQGEALIDRGRQLLAKAAQR